MELRFGSSRVPDEYPRAEVTFRLDVRPLEAKTREEEGLLKQNNVALTLRLPILKRNLPEIP